MSERATSVDGRSSWWQLRLPYAGATGRTLWRVRALICALWFGKLLLDPLAELARLPVMAFQPAGFLHHLPRSVLPYILEPAFLWGFKFAGLALFVAYALRLLPRLTGVLACVHVVVWQGVVRGFGFINHCEISLMLALFVLVLCELGDRWQRTRSHPRSDNPAQTTIVALLFAVSSAYALAGLHRQAFGGFTMYFSDSMVGWLYERGLRTSYFQSTLGHWLAENAVARFAILAGLPFITIAEVAAPFAVLARGVRTIFVPMMLLFHLLVVLSMNILFLENMVLLLLFVDWAPGKAIPTQASPIAAS